MEDLLRALSSVNLRRFIVGIYWVGLVSVGLISAGFFWQTRGEYNRLLKSEAASQRRLTEAQTHLAEQEKILQRLQNDPAYVEKIIRQKLGYARPDEYIFRFEN